MNPITDTFVLVAADCPVKAAVVPTSKRSEPTVAEIQYELLAANPYSLTLEDLIFQTHVRRAGLSRAEVKSRGAAIRRELFAKAHPCMRASPLPKKFGWGVHHDARGRIAIVAMESAEYRRFADGRAHGVSRVPAMRSARAK